MTHRLDVASASLTMRLDCLVRCVASASLANCLDMGQGGVGRVGGEGGGEMMTGGEGLDGGCAGLEEAVRSWRSIFCRQRRFGAFTFTVIIVFLIEVCGGT